MASGWLQSAGKKEKKYRIAVCSDIMFYFVDTRMIAEVVQVRLVDITLFYERTLGAVISVINNCSLRKKNR